MKKLLLLICLMLIPAELQATTTVTGTLQNLGTNNVTTGAYVRFWLRGCGGNQPRVNGTAIIAPSQGGVYFFDFLANGNGAISGTLYSTRDSTGLLGGDIECGGLHTSVWYGMQVFVAGKGGPEVAVHAKNGSSLDVTSVTPITVNPVVVSPTGDTTYMRIDNGNGPFNGNYTLGGNLTLNGTNTTGGAETHNGVETFTSGLTSNNVTDTVLTPGDCVQASAGGLLTTTVGACGTSSGTLTATGVPASPDLACWSGATSLTNCDLSGDVTTSNSAVATVPRINGNSVPSGAVAHQTLVATGANTFSLKTIPDCQDTTGNHLNYTQSTDSYSCGVSVPASTAQIISSGTATMNSGNLITGGCQTVVTVSAPGVTTSDSIEWAYNSVPASADGFLVINPAVTSGNVNFLRCNGSGAVRATSAMVINWRVLR